MAVIGTQPQPTVRWDPSYPYLMTGVAFGSIWVSYILGALFSPGFVTGAQHDHFNSAAAIGWVFNAVTTGLVVTAASQGIRARISDRAPWTTLGLGVCAIWVAVTAVAVFAPVWVTGTDPDKIPVWAGFAAIAGLILTWILCRFVKTASFEPAPPVAGPTLRSTGTIAGPATTGQALDAESADGDATVKLRQLSQLRDSGVITEADFEAKKADLLSRI